MVKFAPLTKIEMIRRLWKEDPTATPAQIQARAKARWESTIHLSYIYTFRTNNPGMFRKKFAAAKPQTIPVGDGVNSGEVEKAFKAAVELGRLSAQLGGVTKLKGLVDLLAKAS